MGNPTTNVSAHVEMPESTARDVLNCLIEKFCQRWDVSEQPPPDGHDHLEAIATDAGVICSVALAMVESAVRDRRYKNSDEER